MINDENFWFDTSQTPEQTHESSGSQISQITSVSNIGRNISTYQHTPPDNITKNISSSIIGGKQNLGNPIHDDIEETIHDPFDDIDDMDNFDNSDNTSGKNDNKYHQKKATIITNKKRSAQQWEKLRAQARKAPSGKFTIEPDL